MSAARTGLIVALMCLLARPATAAPVALFPDDLPPAPERLSPLDPCQLDPEECRDTAMFLSVFGSVALAGGVAGLVAGGIVMNNNRALDTDSDQTSEEKAARREGGTRLLVLGGLASAVGTGMLLGGAMEWRRYRKYRYDPRDRYSLTPLAGPEGGGLLLHGRF